MSANHGQPLGSAHFAAHSKSRRRSVPPRSRTPVPMSQHQRWRERPRCPASRVTQAVGTGSFTPSLVVSNVAVSAHSLCRTNAPPACISSRPDFAGTTRPMNRMEIVRACTQVSRRKHHVCGPRSWYRTIAFLMLAPCSAPSMLFASLRPGRWPGLRALTTPPRGTSGSYAMVVSVSIAQMRLTRESRRRMLASSRQCRTALPPFAPRANGARIRSAPTGHDSSAIPKHRRLMHDDREAVRRRVY